MAKKSKTYVNLVGGGSAAKSRKRKLVAKKGRKADAATRKKSRARGRSSR